MTTTIFLMDDHYKQCPLTCSGQIYLWNNMWIQYTHAIPANRYFPAGQGVGERRIYIQTHTAFLNSDMASKAEQKTSVSSTQQGPAPICHPLSGEDYRFNMLSSHHRMHSVGKPNQKKNLSIYYELTLTHAHSPRSGISSGKLCGDQEKAGFLRLLSNGNCNCSCCCSLWPNFCLLQTPRATLWPGNLHSHRLTSSSKSLSYYFILLLQVGLFSDIALVPASAVCFLLPWKQWNHSHCLCPALTKAWE